MKEWAQKRWKYIVGAVLVLAAYGVAKTHPEWQLEQKLITELQHIVEMTPE